ncbi:MAG: ribonuclease [Jatrophihabitantaceae bacterium]|nr:ribonuclease [Jatrophihabitantaceae bacterium]
MAAEASIPARPVTGRLASLKARWASARERYHWLEHVLRSWTVYKAHHGDHFAAAVTFFSFLSLFPLILLAVSVAGFVLQAQPSLQQDLFDSIAHNVPGSFGDTLSESIDKAINARTGVGVIGLGGLLFTGLGWVANLRAAIEGVWGQEPAKRPFLKAKTADLLVLGGLGLAAVLSIALTAVGATLTSTVLSVLGLSDVPGLFIVTKIIGIALALAGDLLIFGWLLVRLPQATVPRAVGLRGAILAAVGFEILKLAGTFFITRATQSATAGIFASVIGILVWINLVSRFLLFCVAWTSLASGTPPPAQDAPLPVGQVWPVSDGAREAEAGSAVSPGAAAAVLVGAGAVVGAGATLGAARWWRLRRR